MTETAKTRIFSIQLLRVSAWKLRMSILPASFGNPSAEAARALAQAAI